jgi:hypothetical protein
VSLSLAVDHVVLVHGADVARVGADGLHVAPGPLASVGRHEKVQPAQAHHLGFAIAQDGAATAVDQGDAAGGIQRHDHYRRHVEILLGTAALLTQRLATDLEVTQHQGKGLRLPDDDDAVVDEVHRPQPQQVRDHGDAGIGVEPGRDGHLGARRQDQGQSKAEQQSGIKVAALGLQHADADDEEKHGDDADQIGKRRQSFTRGHHREISPV